jgi:lipopolysaccharide biosynthesis protein
MKPYIYKNDYNNNLSKLCILGTHFHTTDYHCPDYIIHFIRSLRNVGYEVILVSNSDIHEESLQKLSEVCCTIALKENEGRDFFSYKYGMSLISEPESLEHLLLANDSIIGPFCDLTGIFSKMNTDFDFWGLTESYEQNYHLQSFFLHANKNVLNSDRWKSFWDGLLLYENKLDIVRNHEIKLTQTLNKDKNLKIGAWVSTEALTQRYPVTEYVNYPSTFFWHDIGNPTVKYWKELLTTFDFPFIKRNLILGKEHYHYTFEGEVFEYKVYPVNWKNIIAEKYGSAYIPLVQDYIGDLFNNNVQQESYTVASFKVLFVYESISGSAQIDYLARLLKFYNDRNIETELIVHSAPLLRTKFDAIIQDITQVNILGELSIKETELLKHKLSQEFIGTIIIGDTASAKLAQQYAYTNAPHILITSHPEPFNVISEEYKYNFHQPKVVSPFNTPGGTPRINFDPVATTIFDDYNKFPLTKVQVISFIGLNDFINQKDQLYLFVRSLKDNGQTCRFRLFLNENEFNKLPALIKSDDHLRAMYEDDIHFSFIQYTSLADHFTNNEQEIVISYFNELYLSDDYLHCYRHNKLLFLLKDNDLHTALGENTEELSFDFYKVDTLVRNVQQVLHDPQQYKKLVTEQNQRFSKYLQTLPVDSYENLLFNQVIDFTELTRKEPIITVIFHFHFYSFDEVSFIYYKRRLRAFYKSNVNYLFSITEDSYEIKKHVASLKNAFPGCIIKIVPNKGRDIGAKFLLFDYLLRTNLPSEYVVVLHDKKSLHLPYLEAKEWIDSLLKIIDPLYYSKILEVFQEDKRLGIVGSAERVVDCIIKWDTKTEIKTPVFEWNNEILHEKIHKYEININDYNFVGGTMFWIKTELLRKLNEKYRFIDQFTSLEEGNVMDNSGSTVTHSWERLISWLSTNIGYKTGKI